jgi:hypothetical protein
MRRASLLLFVLFAAGCEGTANQTVATLPHALAQAWAHRADAIAVSEPCAAHREAGVLRTDVILAVNKRKIPPSLLEPLTGKVNALAAHKPCVPVRREARDLAAWLRNPSG